MRSEVHGRGMSRCRRRAFQIPSHVAWRHGNHDHEANPPGKSSTDSRRGQLSWTTSASLPPKLPS